MGDRQKNPQLWGIQLIRRKQVQQGLVVATALALLISSCSFNDNQSSSSPSTNKQNNGQDEVKAVFYENTTQCEADTKKQQEEYQVLLKAYQNKELANAPTAPKLKPEDCEAQMLAAKKEHDKNAPVYNSLSDCQAEGLQCEPTPKGYYTSGYRPVFGGSYFYPYGGARFIYLNLGGKTRRVYEPRTVYRSNTPGQVVTPYGRTVTKTKFGRTQVPRHTTIPAPKRPSGKAARGTIKGRSSSGFGSTYKGTGRGGK